MHFGWKLLFSLKLCYNTQFLQQTLCFGYRESQEILYSPESILVILKAALLMTAYWIPPEALSFQSLIKSNFFGKGYWGGRNCRLFCTLQLFCYSLRDLFSFLPSPYHRELCTCHQDGGICKDSLHTVGWRHWCLFILQGPDIVEMSALLRGRPS